MSYAIISERDNRFQPRKGLEGPFFYANGRVLYYDPKEGQYYDPLTDYYVEQKEINELHAYLAKVLSR
jgi:hypothetical protein